MNAPVAAFASDPGAAQLRASDPEASVYVAANAGSGKTSTLVKRVARLLLRGARPEAVLCVTYTKAAAAEMQRRLFQQLGAWAVMPDDKLGAELDALGERKELSKARALFAQALETPGGIKITTIHAFCEKLLKRFPLEAGVSPGFTVLDAPAARAVSTAAREEVALASLQNPESPVGKAYAYFSVELDYGRFQEMFAAFEAERRAIRAYVAACPLGRFGDDIWARCGFDEETPSAEIEAETMARIRWGQWGRAAEALIASGKVQDRLTGEAMRRLTEASPFADAWAIFATKDGKPLQRLATKSVDPRAQEWLAQEQARFVAATERCKAARIAEASVHAVNLALAYASLYDAAKSTLRGLDFGDLIERSEELLTRRADAAWVLYKLDGGLDHLLLDEAQDTAPEQWAILRALTAEFFTDKGAGSRERTAFLVGDEKQSIFSFQGAAPERLAMEAQALEGQVRAVGRTFRQTPLRESWRSAPQILAFVDAVFAAPAAAAALKPAGALAFPISHVATRADFGTVDLWPLEETEVAEEPDPWAPVDAAPAESANKKLARRIAVAVRDMVKRGETVADRRGGERRPMGYGDVLILVRRRNALFHEIIRQLKGAGVAVGGADRLLLSEHIAFQDLLALGRFARFAEDDLTLAALLRSPFCAVNESGLYALAQGRGGPLWRVLQARQGERAEWGQAVAFLNWARGVAEARAPFDFYGRVLARLDEEGVSMKRRFLTRLGREAEDALDAFLAEALAAEKRGVIELERFVDEMAASEIEVTREQDEAEDAGGGEVRVMTAHGAKGLEAPVVILPDTTTRATAQGGPLLSAENGGFLWAPRKPEDCPASSAARQARETAAEHESLRLLYVALTRARDRLIIAGVKVQDRFFKGSWREVAEAGFAEERVAGAARTVPLDGGGSATRFGPDPPQGLRPQVELALGHGLPGWALRLAPPEPTAARYAAPSRLSEEARAPAPSPLARTLGLGRYRRGEIVHRLLQLLPDVAADARAAAAARLLARERDLTDEQRAEMGAAALSVLDDARFSAVFGPGSRAEIALSGSSPRLPTGLAVSGRVDRLLVEPGRVLVADFKTNRPAPAAIEAADRAYIRQMAVYWAVLTEIFPGRPVEAALIWTDGPRLMPVPEILMRRALDEMAAPG
jgi:ATP-dependent helicase/nuclease subunit A